MIRSSTRQVKPTRKFEDFKLTANGKKRGRPRKSWSQNETQHIQQLTPSIADIKPQTITQQTVQREELLRAREENNHIAATPVATPKQHVGRPVSSKREEMIRLREENNNLKSKLEQMTTEFDELKRQSSYTGQTVPRVDYDDLKERYQRDLTYAKRHEWCVLCLNPSRYYCCWNTTYCSQKCQVADWYSRHGKSCERRKALKSDT